MLPVQGVGKGGGHSQKSLARMCGPNLENCTTFQTKLCDFSYSISDQDQKISTPFQISFVSTRLYYAWTAANRNWVPFGGTFEKGYKFTDVDAEKIVPTQECKIPNAKPEGKPYPVSDQNGEILCAFSDQNSSKTIYPLVPHIPISGSTPLDYE